MLLIILSLLPYKKLLIKQRTGDGNKSDKENGNTQCRCAGHCLADIVKDFPESHKMDQVTIRRNFRNEQKGSAGRKLLRNSSLAAGKNIDEKGSKRKKKNSFTPPAGSMMCDIQLFKKHESGDLKKGKGFKHSVQSGSGLAVISLQKQTSKAATDQEISGTEKWEYVGKPVYKRIGRSSEEMRTAHHPTR